MAASPTPLMTSRSPLFWITWPLGSAIGFIVPFFAVWILVDVVGGLAGVDLDAAMDANAVVFALFLGLAFGAGGAGMGLVQWLHVRRDIPRSVLWIVGMGAGFVAVAVLYILIWEAFGAARADAFWPRMTNELVHNAAGGALAGYLTWRFVLAPRVAASAWVPFVALAMIAGGLAAWGMEAALGLTAGDAAPVGILVIGIVTAVAYRRLHHQGP
jgi:hypothetical protein